MTIISLFDEISLMNELLSDTVTLIHHTLVINAIKRLISAHDIIELAIQLEKKHAEVYYTSPWEQAAFQDLDAIRCELLSRHASAFKPPTLLPPYYYKMGKLFNVLNAREKH